MKTPARSFDAIKPDPDRVGGVAAAPFVRLPNISTVFATRAARLAALAEGNPLRDYMLFLARIVGAQHAAIAALPPLRSIDALSNATPPLSLDQLDGLDETFRWLLEHVDLSSAPPEAHDARERSAALDRTEFLSLAADVFAAAYPADRLGECLYIAAALQVCLTRHTVLLDAAPVQPVADGLCPVCGQAPVSSLVVGWTQASKARYLCCSLCSTLWNFVRIKCAACGSTKDISYYTVENSFEYVAAEACAACGTFLKHLHQDQDPRLDPFADDVASYGLDLLLRQEFRRSGVNPLFVTG